jgi:hypothetical protein
MAMWIVVTDQRTGARITNASFPWLQWANGGNGQYWVGIGPGGDGAFSVTAPGYNTLWSNTDTYYQMWLAMTQYVPPPPRPVGGGWA